jgi:predicted Zn-dependent protease
MHLLIHAVLLAFAAPCGEPVLPNGCAAAVQQDVAAEEPDEGDLLDASLKIQKGDAEIAEKKLGKILGRQAANVPALELRMLARGLQANFDGATADAESLLKIDAKNAAAHLVLARLALRRGRYSKATEYAKAVAGSPVALAGKCIEVECLDAEGKFDEAAALARKLCGEEIAKKPSTASEWTSLGKLCERAGMLEDASECYVSGSRIKSEDGRDPLGAQDAIVALGNLYHRVYRQADGRPNGEKEFNEVLRENPSHVGALLGRYNIGRANWFLDGARTQECLDRAEEIDRTLPAIHVARAQAFASDRRFNEARAELQKVLAENPSHLEAAIEGAALDYFQKRNDIFETFRAADRTQRPKSSWLPRTVGIYLKGFYRFGDAVPFLQEAVARDGRDGDALTALGECLAHLGREKEAVETLKKAEEVEEGMIHPWRNNMIQALEVVQNKYLAVKSDHFIFYFHPDVEPILRETLPPFYELARKDYGDRYGYVPPPPVKVEVFQRFDDFSVRSVGFAGFGALGVCFGPVITAVSPLTMPFRGSFSYLDTAWHEYSHVIHLALSKGRVPRWFTEGLATLEEVKRNRGFDRHMELDLLEARATGQIYPILDLNSAFRGSRIIFGYYQGGLICEYLEKVTKPERLVDALKLFAEDLPLEDVIQRAFGMKVADLDRGFLEFVDEKLKSVRVRPALDERTMRKLRADIQKNPKNLESLRALAWACVKRGKVADAESVLEKLKAASPEDAEGYLLRAELSLFRKRPDVAMDFYKKGFDGGAEEFFSRMKYAELLLSGKNKDFEEGKKQLRAANAAFPAFADEARSPRMALSKLLAGEEKLDESTALLEELCRVSGTATEARTQLAKRYESKGEHEKLARVLGEMLDVDPFQRSLQKQHALVLLQLKKFDDAARAARLARLVFPALEPEKREPGERREPTPTTKRDADDDGERSDCAAIEALALFEAGKIEDARTALKLSLKLDPGNERAAELQKRMDSGNR